MNKLVERNNSNYGVKKMKLKLLIILVPLVLSLNASACYVGPHIRCCHPMIGCDIDTQDFIESLNTYKSSLMPEVAENVESDIYFTEENDKLPDCSYREQTHCNHPASSIPIKCYGMHMPMKASDGHWYCQAMGH